MCFIFRFLEHRRATDQIQIYTDISQQMFYENIPETVKQLSTHLDTSTDGDCNTFVNREDVNESFELGNFSFGSELLDINTSDSVLNSVADESIRISEGNTNITNEVMSHTPYEGRPYFALCSCHYCLYISIHVHD